MKLKQLVVLLVTVLFASAAYSGDKAHHKMEIKVVSDDGSGETSVVLDSDELGFDLNDMQVGENRSVIDKEGRPILITRNEDGYTLDVDGKSIDLPPMDHAEHAMMRKAHMKGQRKHHVMRESMQGVMIISGEEIDEATQAVIRTALESAGHTEVHFAGGHDGGPHQVHVIREEVEVTK